MTEHPEVKAIIFDCDGTLADTMPAHFEPWTQGLPPHQFELSEDRFYALGGWPTEKIIELLAGETGRDVDVAAMAHEKEAAYQDLLEHVRPIEAVVNVVKRNRGRLPMAVATGACRSICEATLRRIGLSSDLFETIVSCEDVAHHKPAPDIFLEAARRLGVPAAECVVYEDTSPGIEAARRAGMAFVDVRQFYTPRRVTACG
jgi:HAD superfamily hydrolase (TIGR01509 family)